MADVSEFQIEFVSGIFDVDGVGELVLCVDCLKLLHPSTTISL